MGETKTFPMPRKYFGAAKTKSVQKKTIEVVIKLRNFGVEGFNICYFAEEENC